MEDVKPETVTETPEPDENELKARKIQQEFGKMCAMYGDAHFKVILAEKAKEEIEQKMNNLQVDYEKITAKIQKAKQTAEVTQ